MKKICYVVTIPLTVRSFFIPQLKYLADNGFDVTVVCCDDGAIAGELGGKIHFRGIDIPRGVSLAGSVKAISSLVSFFKQEKFDLIQYSTPNAGLYAAIAAAIAGCRVRNYHLMGYRYVGAKGMGRAVLKLLEKLTCALSTSIECVSRLNLDFGVSEGIFKREKAAVVWNGSSGGVNLEKFDINKRPQWRKELRCEFGYKEEDTVFGFVGRLTGDKGINELLEAFFSLKNGSKLFIIGPNENDGTINPGLWEKAKACGDIIIHDPSNEIEKFYAMTDVLVLPSYREGFGNVVIEAAAMGTPAIASDIPGPADCIKDGVTGALFPNKDAGALAEAMLRVSETDYAKTGLAAAEYVKASFDSRVLNEKVLERKLSLM